jgi:hypothetical protein
MMPTSSSIGTAVMAQPISAPQSSFLSKQRFLPDHGSAPKAPSTSMVAIKAMTKKNRRGDDA